MFLFERDVLIRVSLQSISFVSYVATLTVSIWLSMLSIFHRPGIGLYGIAG